MVSEEHKIRLAAFSWLDKQVALHGDVLPWRLLQQGFDYEGQRVHLISQQGIFKPRMMTLPLTITTVAEGPYNDSFQGDYLLYRYRGKNLQHPDNVGLRQSINKHIPLIYFHGVVKGKYLAVWPVYIVGDDQKNLTFTVAVDDISAIGDDLEQSRVAESRREYITSNIRVRLHQRGFREKVLQAYRTQCALCRLRHAELLDAAHIIPDTEPEGRPTVDNGISLCKIHHAAFDKFLLAITPDYKVEVRPDILEEDDGPMLQHGLKEMHAGQIVLPRSRNLWPDRNLLEKRYYRFKEAM